jgi:hypothetical protein
MLLITIKLVFKKGFWDGLQYFDFFEAFPRDCRHLWSIAQCPERRATRRCAEQAPKSGLFASNRRNGGGGPMPIWKFLSYILTINAPRAQK